MNWKQHSKALTLILVTVCILSTKPIFAKSVTFQREYTYRASKADSKLAHVNRGLAYMENGQYGLAIRDFNKALEIDPSSVEIYLNRGTAYSEKSRHDAPTVYGGTSPNVYDLAIASFNKALEIDPSCVRAYLNRGFAYLVQGQYDLAIRDYSKALEIDPSNANTYVNRCLAYSSLGLDQQAIKDYRAAARLGDEEAQSFLTSEGIGW
jgi:Tfp pilus assembly protein PilF